MNKTVLNVSEIKSNPNNPRLIKDDKFKKLVASIQEFPEMLEAREIVVNQDNIILGGNMRFKAAKEAGLKELPVKIVDWSEDKQRQFVIKDNVSGGEWDWDVLANEWEAEELNAWGLDTPADWGEEVEVEEDEAPEVSDEPAVSRLGEIYQLGRHRVMCGDAVESRDVAELMNGNQADMVFTDPPYGVSYKNNMNDNFEVIKNDDVFLDFIPQLKAHSRQNIHWYIWTSDPVYPKWRDMFSEYFKSTVIWFKGGGGIGDLTGDYARNYEMALFCQFGRKELKGKREGLVWEIGKDNGSEYTHPTQKPVALSAYAIKKSSSKADVILDLFLGSGSTLIGCEQTDRSCYGMELDPKYVDVIRKRYWKFVNGSEEGWEDGTPVIQ